MFLNWKQIATQQINLIYSIEIQYSAGKTQCSGANIFCWQ